MSQKLDPYDVLLTVSEQSDERLKLIAQIMGSVDQTPEGIVRQVQEHKKEEAPAPVESIEPVKSIVAPAFKPNESTTVTPHRTGIDPRTGRVDGTRTTQAVFDEVCKHEPDGILAKDIFNRLLEQKIYRPVEPDQKKRARQSVHAALQALMKHGMVCRTDQRWFASEQTRTFLKTNGYCDLQSPVVRKIQKAYLDKNNGSNDNVFELKSNGVVC